MLPLIFLDLNGFQARNNPQTCKTGKSDTVSVFLSGSWMQFKARWKASGAAQVIWYELFPNWARCWLTGVFLLREQKVALEFETQFLYKKFNCLFNKYLFKLGDMGQRNETWSLNALSRLTESIMAQILEFLVMCSTLPPWGGEDAPHLCGLSCESVKSIYWSPCP